MGDFFCIYFSHIIWTFSHQIWKCPNLWTFARIFLMYNLDFFSLIWKSPNCGLFTSEFLKKIPKSPNCGLFTRTSLEKITKKSKLWTFYACISQKNYTCISPENHKEVQDVDKSMCALLVKKSQKRTFYAFVSRKYYKGVQIVDFLCMLF